MSECWYCDGYADYHPACDRPDCENQTHGYGSEGKRVRSYCDECSGGAA